MIISHKYKFIFVKTAKTAGTSIEVFLSQCCGDTDVVTPLGDPVPPHVPRNYRGLVNPLNEIILGRGRHVSSVFRRFVQRKKFYNHMPAKVIRSLVPHETWNDYFKFCVERNPWDKTLSHYHMLNHRRGGALTLDNYLRKGRFCTNLQNYTDNSGRVIVDRILRYESLMEELGDVFGKLGIPFTGTLGVKAKSQYRNDRRPYQQVYTERQRQIVANIFRKEIEMHGYTF